MVLSEVWIGGFGEGGMSGRLFRIQPVKRKRKCQPQTTCRRPHQRIDRHTSMTFFPSIAFQLSSPPQTSLSRTAARSPAHSQVFNPPS
jgi:hypothetical protein